MDGVRRLDLMAFFSCIKSRSKGEDKRISTCTYAPHINIHTNIDYDNISMHSAIILNAFTFDFHVTKVVHTF